MSDETGFYQQPQLYTDQQKVENALRRELNADEVGYLPFQIEAASESIRKYTGRTFIADTVPSDRYYDSEEELTREIFVDDYCQYGIPSHEQWIFTVSGVSEANVGDVYQNTNPTNGITYQYKVILFYTNPNNNQQYIVMQGNGQANPDGGNLIRVSGTGDSSIAFTVAGINTAIEVATLNIWDNQITGTIIPPYSYIEYPLNTTWKNSVRFRGFPFAVGGRRFRVTAAWGYSQKPPGGIVNAATMLVMHMLENPLDIQQESIEGYQRIFAPKSTGEEDLIMPPKIKLMLDLYKKRSADL